MNITQNFKQGFAGKNLIAEATGALVPAYSAFVPSMLGINGWLGWAIAYVIPYLAGKAFNLPIVSAVALGLGFSNIIYAFSDNVTVEWGLNKDASGHARGLWYLDETNIASTTPAATKDLTLKSSYSQAELDAMAKADPTKFASLKGLGYIPYGQLPPGASTQYINGQPVVYYDKNNFSPINDYVGKNEPLFLNDYVKTESNIFDNDFYNESDRF